MLKEILGYIFDSFAGMLFFTAFLSSMLVAFVGLFFNETIMVWGFKGMVASTVIAYASSMIFPRWLD